jgi:Holliday junction DNA helicase RuvA
MIGFLRGVLHHRDHEGRLVVDVGGVGYVVTVGLAAFAQLADGEAVTAYIHTNVKEDELSLYGFESSVELHAFRQLLAVSGIGPKVALAVLTNLSPAALGVAIEGGDAAAIARAKGVGKRMAEKVIVELKGKFDPGTLPAGLALVTPAPAKASAAEDDLRSALTHLQYRPKEIDAVIGQLRAEREAQPADSPAPALDALLRRALSLLRR